MPLESAGSGVSRAPKPEEAEAVEKKTYQLETGESIEVLSKEFTYTPTESDKGKEGVEERNVVFLPGWKMAADSAAAKSLCEAFAERARGNSFSVTTRAEESPGTEDPLYKEALAISKFIKEKGLKNIVLAGHSQGGDKAVDLATILQQDPDLHISGLVLLDSMGLYEQDSLTKDFLKDSTVHTPKTLLKHAIKKKDLEPIRQGLRTSNSVTGAVFREIATSGTKSIKRMKDEISVMARRNSRLDQVQVPVILMSGSEDIISDPNKIIPPGEEAWVVEEWEKKDEVAETDTYIDPREKFLQDEMFPQSPYVRAVFPEKLGHHNLPLFRPASVANASLYLLERFERRAKTKLSPSV